MGGREWLRRVGGAVGTALRVRGRACGPGWGTPLPDNPYVAGHPLLDDRLFVGREPLVQRVLQTVHGNSVLLCGEARIGTTSLLHHLARRLVALDEPGFRFAPVLVDLDATSEERFFLALAEAVREQLGTGSRLGLAAAEGPGHRAMLVEVRHAVRALSANDPRPARLVLLVDNIDRLNRYQPRTNQCLRSLFMKSLAEHLVCVAAGRAIERDWDRASSPWYNFFEELEVPPLDRDAAMTLVTRPVAGSFTFASEAVEGIVARCQGRPEAIQRLCRALVDRAIERRRHDIGVEDLEAVVAG